MPEWAWFLGYMWADGSFYRDISWALELKSDDFEDIWPTLQKIGFMSFTERMRQGKYIQRALNGSKCIKFFARYGYTDKSVDSPRKIWEILDFTQRRLFMRGLFDGDGSYSNNGKGGRITMNGPKNYDWNFLLDFFKANGIGVPCIERKTRLQKGKDRSYSILSWCNRYDIAQIVKLLYTDNLEIGLSRKQIKTLSYKTLGDLKVREFPIGVRRTPNGKKFIAYRYTKIKDIYLGTFPTLEEAISAQQVAMK